MEPTTRAPEAVQIQAPPTPEQQALEQELILAAEAISDTPGYVAHIGGMFARCASRLRGGDRRDGYNDLCQGIADLDQFVVLFDQIWRVANPTTVDEASSFKSDLVDSMRTMELAINSQNTDQLCTEIEARFLPLLPRWGSVATELLDGLRARA